MKSLIAEDEFICRNLIQRYLNPLGEVDVAVSGSEAYSAFLGALDSKAPYDLICLDINMPALDGVSVLKQIRAEEDRRGIRGLDGVKILMVSGCDDTKEILGAFRAGCEAYIVKPLVKGDLMKEISKLGLA